MLFSWVVECKFLHNYAHIFSFFPFFLWNTLRHMTWLPAQLVCVSTGRNIVLNVAQNCTLGERGAADEYALGGAGQTERHAMKKPSWFCSSTAKVLQEITKTKTKNRATTKTSRTTTVNRRKKKELQVCSTSWMRLTTGPVDSSRVTASTEPVGDEKIVSHIWKHVRGLWVYWDLK